MSGRVLRVLIAGVFLSLAGTAPARAQSDAAPPEAGTPPASGAQDTPPGEPPASSDPIAPPAPVLGITSDEPSAETPSAAPVESETTSTSEAASEPADAAASSETDTDTETPRETPAPSGDEDIPPAEVEGDGLIFGIHIGPGEYQLRGNALSDIPLQAASPRMPGEPPVGPSLGQNWFAEQWLRAAFRMTLSDHRDASGNASPFLTLFGQMDLLWGVAFGQLAQGTFPAAYARDEYGYPGIRLRQLYLEWRSPIGIFRAGQMTFTWGLGIIANDGQTPQPFGDYRFGSLVRRVMFATRPLGETTPFTVAIAGDWVAWDLTADGQRPCLRPMPASFPNTSACGDTAFQGVLAGFYGEGDDQVGAYVAYRTQHDWQNDFLDVFVGDVFARWHFAEPTGGRFFFALETAYIRGATSLTRTATRPRADVEQFLLAAQLGRRHEQIDLVFEGGFASGDSNTEDGTERRGTFNPDHRVGLVLFPEVLAAMSARAAFLAQDPDTFGRPQPGAQLLPTNGGVSGAFYLFPYMIWRPLPWLDLRVGGLLAWTSVDLVDAYRQRAEGRSVNYRGGDPTRHDLGLELDGAIRVHTPLTEWLEFQAGLEGGVLFPGRAFDDANGQTMGSVGMARLRLGLAF